MRSIRFAALFCSAARIAMIGAAVWLCGSGSVALATQLTQMGDPASYLLVNDDSSSPGAFNLFAGGLSDGSTYNAVYIVALPQLPANNVISSADLEYQFHDIQGTPSFNADLNGIGFYNSTAPVDMFSLSNVPEVGATKLQDNLMTTATGPINGFMHLSTAGDTALAAYLQGFYTANPTYSGGDYVFLRINPDAVPNAGDTYYRVYGGSVDGAPILTINTALAPEPTSISLVTVVSLCAASTLRRRRKPVR